MEKIFNNGSPLTISVVSLLPTSHPVANIKSVIENILRFSPILKISSTPTSDLQLTLTEEKENAVMVIRQGEKEIAQVRIENEAKKNASNLVIVQYMAIYGFFMGRSDMFFALARKKWMDNHMIPSESIGYTYTIANQVPSDSPLALVAQGYVLALQELFTSTVGTETTLSIAGEIRIHLEAGETENIVVDLHYTLPNGNCLVMSKRSYSMNPFEEGETEEEVLVDELTIALPSMNLLHANALVVLPRVKTAQEWATVLLANYYADWKEEIDERDQYITVADSKSEITTDKLIVLPAESYLPVRIVEQEKGNVPTKNRFQNVFKEVFPAPQLHDLERYCDLNIAYEKSIISFKLGFQGQQLLKGEISAQDIPTQQEEIWIRNFRYTLFEKCNAPLSIFHLTPQASA